jgi:hypothetical protein
MIILILPLEPSRKTSDSNSWQYSHSHGTFIKLVLTTLRELQKLRGVSCALRILLLTSPNVMLVDLVSRYGDIEPYLISVSPSYNVFSL